MKKSHNTEPHNTHRTDVHNECEPLNITEKDVTPIDPRDVDTAHYMDHKGSVYGRSAFGAFCVFNIFTSKHNQNPNNTTEHLIHPKTTKDA
jgi:hypothetical protein